MATIDSDTITQLRDEIPDAWLTGRFDARYYRHSSAAACNTTAARKLANEDRRGATYWLGVASKLAEGGWSDVQPLTEPKLAAEIPHHGTYEACAYHTDRAFERYLPSTVEALRARVFDATNEDWSDCHSAMAFVCVLASFDCPLSDHG